MVSGNKGEWSEFYAFLKIISERCLKAADKDLQFIEGIYYPVIKIIRENSNSERIIYELPSESNSDTINVVSSSNLRAVVISDLPEKTRRIFDAMNQPRRGSFSIPVATELMERLDCDRIRASNNRKADLVLMIHDHRTGADPEVGFSIKSRIGSPSTLLNASQATNFIFQIADDGSLAREGLSMTPSRPMLRDSSRTAGYTFDDASNFVFEKVQSETFEDNMRRIDTILPEIIAELLKAYYISSAGSKLSELVEFVSQHVPEIRGFRLTKADYEFKVKNLLWSIALGMVPGTDWDGSATVHGGYIIVKEDGELACYHVYNFDEFKDYLYSNTKFDTPSTTRHGFGHIYDEDGRRKKKYNLQIRFVR